MITQFKIFEIVNSNHLENLKAGDYVILSANKYNSTTIGAEGDLPESDIFWHNKIGKLMRVRQHYNEIDINFGGDIGKMFGVRIFNIKCWSSDKEALEAFIAAEKYNI